MPTDPAILAQLQTLWGEPVTETTAEADSEAAFRPSEWLPSPIPPTRPADAPATWDAVTAELIGWLQANRNRLPVEPFRLCRGRGWSMPSCSIARSTPTSPTGRMGHGDDTAGWLTT